MVGRVDGLHVGVDADVGCQSGQGQWGQHGLFMLTQRTDLVIAPYKMRSGVERRPMLLKCIRQRDAEILNQCTMQAVAKVQQSDDVRSIDQDIFVIEIAMQHALLAGLKQWKYA